jgi:hypothetical protein
VVVLVAAVVLVVTPSPFVSVFDGDVDVWYSTVVLVVDVEVLEE